MTQSRVQNIPLFLLFRIIHHVLLYVLPSMFSALSVIHLTSSLPKQNITISAAIIVTTTTVLMTQTSFFALGNSNAISSIDLSNAYNGVSGYNVAMVGILVFLGNWAGPIYWSAAGVVLMQRISYVLEHAEDDSKPAALRRLEKETKGAVKVLTRDQYESKEKEKMEEERRKILEHARRQREEIVSAGNERRREWVTVEHDHLNASASASSPPAVDSNSITESSTSRASSLSLVSISSPIFVHITLLTAFTTISLLAVMVACMFLRQHLFIWTVFSPKYLYAMAWGCLWHLVVAVGMSELLWVC
jgi:ethanolamine phosphate transferase 2 subunit G